MASWKLKWWCTATSSEAREAAFFIPNGMKKKTIASFFPCQHMLYFRNMYHLMRVDRRKKAHTPSSLGLLCDTISAHAGACIYIFFYFVFRTRYTYESEHDWLWSKENRVFKQGKRTSLSAPNQMFSIAAGFPQWQPFYFLRDRVSAKPLNIYEGVWDSTPFQDLPLWLWVRPFSSALNNSCIWKYLLSQTFFPYLM